MNCPNRAGFFKKVDRQMNPMLSLRTMEKKLCLTATTTEKVVGNDLGRQAGDEEQWGGAQPLEEHVCREKVLLVADEKNFHVGMVTERRKDTRGNQDSRSKEPTEASMWTDAVGNLEQVST